MDKRTADYLLGKLNGQYDNLKEGIQRIEDKLEPLQTLTSKNEKSISNIKLVGKVIGTIWGLFIPGFGLWLRSKK